MVETPFHDDGRLDLPGFDRVVDAMAAVGVRWVMYPGYASEFHKLSDGERATLIDRMVRRSGACGLDVVVQVAAQATRQAVDNARWAADLGAAAINLLPPHVVPTPTASLADHIAAVLQAAAPLPVIVQYAPALAHAAPSLETLSELARSHVNLVAVKVEASPRAITALGALRPRLRSLVGYGGMHLPQALLRGAIGVQPGCSFVEIYQTIWRSWTAGDHASAEACYRRLLPYLAYWMQDVELIIAAEKRISVARGWFTSPHCREPGWRLDRHEIEAIDRFCHEFSDVLGIADRA